MMASNPVIVVIVGPTGVGKTGTGITLARQFNGEIISADSRQVYRYMDIGTAKPTVDEQAAAPHHLIDFLNPDEWLGLAQYQQLAYRGIDEALHHGRLPILVGGTGQYVRAVVEGWGIPEVEPHHALRAELESFADVYGAEALGERLAQLDPESAESIDYRNVRRVVRALEVCIVTGQRFSDLRRAKPVPYRVLQIGLTMPRDALYARVDVRVDRMIEDGLVAEVQSLLERGYSIDLPAMTSLGYAEIVRYLQGSCTLEQAVSDIKVNTHRYIRHQYNWFSLENPHIKWFDVRAIDTSDIVGWVRLQLTVDSS